MTIVPNKDVKQTKKLKKNYLRNNREKSHNVQNI